MGWYCVIMWFCVPFMAVGLFTLNCACHYFYEVVGVGRGHYKLMETACRSNVTSVPCMAFHSRLALCYVTAIICTSELFVTASIIIDIYNCWKVWIGFHLTVLLLIASIIITGFWISGWKEPYQKLFNKLKSTPYNFTENIGSTSPEKFLSLLSTRTAYCLQVGIIGGLVAHIPLIIIGVSLLLAANYC